MSIFREEKMSLDQRFSWRLKALREAQGLTQDKLSEQSTVSAQTISFVECGRSSPSLATAELLVHGLGFENLEAFLSAPIPEKHPILEDIPEDAKNTTHLPLYSYEAACGYFENGGESGDVLGWVEVRGLRRKLNPNMLLVRARGTSMEPRIHDGDLCVFLRYTPTSGGSRNGEIMLFNLHDDTDPDDGANCVIKTYYSTWELDEDGNRHLKELVLVPLNPQYKIMRFTEDDLQGKQICPVAFFLTTL